MRIKQSICACLIVATTLAGAPPSAESAEVTELGIFLPLIVVVGERVDTVIVQRPKPGNPIPSDTNIKYIYEVRNIGGGLVGVYEQVAAFSGLAPVTWEIVGGSAGAEVIANGDMVGVIPAHGGPLAIRVDVRREMKGVRQSTGAQVTIPASVGASAIVRQSDATGATLATWAQGDWQGNGALNSPDL